MKPVTEWKMWTHGLFIQSNDTKGDRTTGQLIVTIPFLLLFAIVGAILFVPADAFTPAIVESSTWNGFYVLATVAFSIVAPHLSKIHKAYAVGWAKDYYGHVTPLAQRVKFYLSLDKEDRELYPRNLIDVLTNPALNDDQRNQLSAVMHTVERKINERNRVRAEAFARSIDIDGVIDDLHRVGQHVQIETKTIKELF